MVFHRFHRKVSGKRRGEKLPGRLRVAARPGVTLVELMIAMLILTIVCISWLQIIGIQSARKEACRREAVERLSGIMDAFIQMTKTGTKKGYYNYKIDQKTLSFSIDESASSSVDRIFKLDGDPVSPIGYQLQVVKKSQWDTGTEWPDKNKFDEFDDKFWLIGRLYDGNGQDAAKENPFFVLPVYLGL